MVILKDKLVRIPNGDWMLCSYDKLIRVARMFIVMNNICNKYIEDINLLKLILEVALAEQIVHSLKRINDMELAVIRILLEVTLGHL